MHIYRIEKTSRNTYKYMNNSTFIRIYIILKTGKRACVLFHLSIAHNFHPECCYSLILRDFFTFCQYKTRHQLFVAVFKVDLQMKASLSLPDYASLIRPTSLFCQSWNSKEVSSIQSRLRDFMAFQSHCLTSYLSLNKQSMPYWPRA